MPSDLSYPIDLSYITFTEQDDIVPESGYYQQILNRSWVDTYAGNDRISGTGIEGETYGFKNEGILNTDDGDDIITGSLLYNRHSSTRGGFSIINLGTLNTGEGNDLIYGGGSYGYTVFSGIYAPGTLNAGGGNDTIIGAGSDEGILVETGTLNMGEGNDHIQASGYGEGGYGYGNIGLSLWYGGTIDTGNGEDSIIITQGGFTNGGEVFLGDGNDSIISGNFTNGGEVFLGEGSDSLFVGALDNYKTIETGDGNDVITSSTTSNEGVINTGKDNDSINFDYSLNNNTIETGDGNDSLNYGYFVNRGHVFLGEGNDSIAPSPEFSSGPIENFGFMGTGEGNDIFTSTGGISNEGFIETGNGDDSIIADGGYDYMTGTAYGIYNNGGVINMGDGNDSIITDDGFESGPNSSGAWFLGEGEDYIKGFGGGDFYGGNGLDRLELTPGTYTLKKWADNTGESVVFTKGNQLMITSQFEQLIAGSTTYDFTSLTEGQIIVVS